MPPRLGAWACAKPRKSSVYPALFFRGACTAIFNSMSDEFDFEPRLGRIRTRGRASGRKYLHRILAAANLVRGSASALAGRGRFAGARGGRGAGIGRLLATGDRFAGLRGRRVIVKSRIVRLAGKDPAAARAHLRYVARGGTTREGEPGGLYGAEADAVDGKAFLARGAGDRHQFRFILSAEDGADYDDLRPLTRRLMAQVEEDLGTRLDWVAVDHHDTGHPHSHIIVRGRDAHGKDLVIARDYLTAGMCARAAELIDLDLGPRSDFEISGRLRAEVGQERLTGIDRALLRDAGADGTVSALGRDALDQALRIGRLRQLERFGLARRLRHGRWQLLSDLDATLRRMGERGDIIRTLQRAHRDRGRMPSPADLVIHDLAAPATGLVGRVLERGLADELEDRHYLVLEATDGRSHYLEIGKGVAVETPPAGGVVRIVPTRPAVRPADRAIATVAAANGGLYTVDAHLRLDPSASEAFAETHVRRLEAMRRLTGAVERRPDGSWVVAPDHLDRAAAFEALRARDRPVMVETLSERPLEQLVEADAATWLDRELVAAAPEALRDAGFGAEVRTAQARRRQWLIAQQLAVEEDGTTLYPPRLIETLRRRELVRVAGQLSAELGLPFVDAEAGMAIAGRLRRRVDLVSGRFALVENAREFTLVPWRPMLEQHVGKSVSGIMRPDRINWTLGRQRGPTIS